MISDSSRRLRVVIVDDEELARAVLREYLDEHPDVEVVAECGNGFEAVKAVNDLAPDLLLLDIQMPKLDGFEVLELVGTGPAVVFVTAYDQYAIQAFEVRAVDYLLKPFTAERLARSLDLARERIRRGDASPLEDLALEARRRSRPLDRILVRDGPRVHVIPTARIDFIEAQDDYVGIRSGGKTFLKQETMALLETLLDSRTFIRVHRSYILNVERLARIELLAKDNRVAFLSDGTQIPVSRTGYARLKPLL